MSYPPPPGQPNAPYGTDPQQPYGPGSYGQPQPGVPQQQAPAGYGYPQPGPATPPPPPATPPANPYGGGQPQQPYQQPQQGYGFPQQPAPQQPWAPPGQAGGSPFGSGYATWGARLGAVLIDGVIMGIVPGILYGVGLTMAFGDSTRTTGIVLVAVAAVLALAAFLLIGHREGATGQTPGKKMLNIRVVNRYDGQPNGGGMGILRWFCRALNSIFLLGYLWPLWDEQCQTFADKALNTIVVKSAP